MLITIYNRSFQRVKPLTRFTFAQYTEKLQEVGTFRVLVEMHEDNIMFLDKEQTYYLLFDNNVMGRIEESTKDSDGEFNRSIELVGSLMTFILDKRVIYPTQNFKGTTAKVIGDVIKQNFVPNDYENKRYINLIVKYTNDTMLTTTSSVEFQKTGGTVLECIQPLMEQDKLGIRIVPQIRELHEVVTHDPLTNISVWDCYVIQGVDRTRKNISKALQLSEEQKENNTVIFSQSYSNLYRTTYNMSKKDYTNVAYVAGEGEGTARKIIEVYQPDKEDLKDNFYEKGWYRNETFIDARDLQKEQDGKILTDAEYQELLKQRGLEKLKEHIVFETYDGTIVTESGTRYVYRKDFDIGDFVTTVDTEIGANVTAQLTSVTVSIEGSTETIDIEVGNPKITIDQKLKRNGVI